MLKRSAGILVGIVTLTLPLQAAAIENKYHVTDAEQSACSADAISLCGDVGQDEDKLLACMKANRTGLSAGCRPVFEQGLRQRGLH